MQKRRLSLFSLFLAFVLLLSGCRVGQRISLPREDSLDEEPALPAETPQPDPQPEVGDLQNPGEILLRRADPADSGKQYRAGDRESLAAGCILADQCV